MRREPSPTAAECEAIARLTKAPAQAVVLLNPDGLTKSPNYSQIALVKAPKVCVYGVANRVSHAGRRDVKLALRPLGEDAGFSDCEVFKRVLHAHHALTAQAMDRLRAVEVQLLGQGASAGEYDVAV